MLLLLAVTAPPSAAADELRAGLARADITPREPVRLSGYSHRSRPSEGVGRPLHARALAIAGSEGSPSILITADLIGVPAWLRAQLEGELEKALDVAPENLAICATHTHTGPQLRGVLPGMFLADLSPDELEAIDRYSNRLVPELVGLARSAVEALRPARLARGEGSVGFARNRRVLEDGRWKGFGVNPDGPVDHDLPLLRVVDGEGKLLGVLATYACHCTGFGGNHNRIHSDWAGVAADTVEARHPGAICLVSIGCGADQNPEPRGTTDDVNRHGAELAREIERLLASDALRPLRSAPQGRLERIPLRFDSVPGREEIEERARSSDRWAYPFKKLLERLDRGETIPETLDYPVQTWIFGRELAMVFLAGEVVVDYSLRLERELDRERLWVHAYANAAPCYIASRRLYDEGGYEVDRSMGFYGQPGRLAPDTEDRVVDDVVRQVPHDFYANETRAVIPPPVDRDAALATIRTLPGLEVELVAAEPLVEDPVHISWGLDGRMWVAEMADYPLGIDGEGTPGGRVRVLSDGDGDGIFDRSTLFVDGLSYPNSVMPWRDGVLVCAAPEVLHARDVDGDGRADRVETLLSGFTLWNQQHLVNGFEWGLDGWVHLANGDSGGRVRSLQTEQIVELRGRDLRFRPATGEIELVEGQTQYGRRRDDRGNWFGCDNTRPAWHYVLPDRYLRRNPHVSYPPSRKLLFPEGSSPPVFPASRTIVRLNDYDTANRFTSACGLTIYRDELLGEEFRGSLLVCEPVHNLVHRSVIESQGVTFSSHRAPGEESSELFASTDNWCRPTSVHTGPDGAIYVVDMYRYAIEHPEWIPEDWKRRLDLRDGHDRGRIYRIFPRGQRPSPVPDRSTRSSTDLVEELRRASGVVRDRVSQELIERGDDACLPALKSMLRRGESEVARLHALVVLAELDALDPALLKDALQDPSPAVRRQALVRAEPRIAGERPHEEMLFRVIESVDDADPQVGLQAILSLGQTDSPRAAAVLARVARERSADIYIRAAVLSSVRGSIAEVVRRLDMEGWPSGALRLDLVRTAVGEGSREAVGRVLRRLGSSGCDSVETLRELSLILRLGRREGSFVARLRSDDDPHLARAFERIDELARRTRAMRVDRGLDASVRVAAIGVPARGADAESELRILLGLLDPVEPPSVQEAALDSLRSLNHPAAPGAILARWREVAPATRRRLAELLAGRDDWLRAWLEMARDDPSLRHGFDPVLRSRLIRHPRRELRALALEVLGGDADSDRGELVEQTLEVLPAEGDPARGRSHFKKSCATCHRLGDLGTAIGPDLAALVDRSPRTLITAILDPNRAVEDRYLQYRLILTDGRTVTGMVRDESATHLEVAVAEGRIETVLRKDIASFEGLGLSLMPEGLESTLDPQALVDLIAFLGSEGPDRSLSPSADGSVSLLASAARIAGQGSAVLDPALEAITYIDRGDRLTWTVQDLPAGLYDIFFHAAVAPRYSGPLFSVRVGEHIVRGEVERTGSRTAFRQRKFGRVRLQEPDERLEVEFYHELSSPEMSVREIRLVPVR